MIELMMICLKTNLKIKTKYFLFNFCILIVSICSFLLAFLFKSTKLQFFPLTFSVSNLLRIN